MFYILFLWQSKKKKQYSDRYKILKEKKKKNKRKPPIANEYLAPFKYFQWYKMYTINGAPDESCKTNSLPEDVLKH